MYDVTYIYLFILSSTYDLCQGVFYFNCINKSGTFHFVIYVIIILFSQFIILINNLSLYLSVSK